MADGTRDFLGAPKINKDFTVTVPGHGRLSAAQVTHVIPGGAGLAMKMKAAEARQNPTTDDGLRPFERTRLTGVPLVDREVT